MSTTSTESKAVDAVTATPEGNALQLTQIPVDQLIPFKLHIFKPYSEQRMKTLVASVQENGIIHPVVVRHMKGKDNHDKFEIISGHNRVGAARLAKMEKIPVIVMELSDDEAVIFANEANIESRNFATWLPSEKIKSINQYHAAVKSQGKAKDSKSASGDKRQKSEDGYARQRTAQVYGLSPSKVRSFIELSRLIESLQDRLDAEDFGTTPASELSFISVDGQKVINSVLDEDKNMQFYKITIKRSEELRAFFENDVDESLIEENEVDIKDGVRKILSNSKDATSEAVPDDLVKIPISQEEFTELFPDVPSPEDIAVYMVMCARYCIENKVIQREGAV